MLFSTNSDYIQRFSQNRYYVFILVYRATYGTFWKWSVVQRSRWNYWSRNAHHAEKNLMALLRSNATTEFDMSHGDMVEVHNYCPLGRTDYGQFLNFCYLLMKKAIWKLWPEDMNRVTVAVQNIRLPFLKDGFGKAIQSAIIAKYRKWWY